MSLDDARPEPEFAELIDWLPAPVERDLAPDRQQVLRQRLVSEIRARAASRDSVAKSPRRRLARLVPMTAAALAAVTAVVVTVATGNSGGPSAVTGTDKAQGQQQPASSPAVQLLALAATSADRQVTPVVHDNQYEYVESEVSFIVTSQTPPGPDGRPGAVTTHEPLHDRRVWLPVADLCQHGLLREDDRDTDLTRKNNLGGVTCPYHGDLNNPTYRLLASLPTDPHAMLAMVYAAVGPGAKPGADRDSRAFDIIGGLLRESVPPPQIAAALYRAAGLIPGVQVLPDAVDAAGRHGTAVALESAGLRTEWIFDGSGGLLGQRDVLTADDYRGKKGDVIASTAILAKAIVDEIGATR